MRFPEDVVGSGRNHILGERQIWNISVNTFFQDRSGLETYLFSCSSRFCLMFMMLALESTGILTFVCFCLEKSLKPMVTYFLLLLLPGRCDFSMREWIMRETVAIDLCFPPQGILGIAVFILILLNTDCWEAARYRSVARLRYSTKRSLSCVRWMEHPSLFWGWSIWGVEFEVLARLEVLVFLK